MTLFSSLLPPKATSCGFSILCVGEEAFTHLFVLQRRLSFALLCFLAFLLPSEYVWLSPSRLSVKTFHSSLLIFCAFNPLKRFRLAFSFLCVGEDVFINFFTASESGGVGGVGGGGHMGAQPPPPPHLQGGPPSKRASKAISQGISFCVVEKIFLLFA